MSIYESNVIYEAPIEEWYAEVEAEDPSIEEDDIECIIEEIKTIEMTLLVSGKSYTFREVDLGAAETVLGTLKISEALTKHLLPYTEETTVPQGGE